MHERLTSRGAENELLFNGVRVITGEHCQAYLELEEAEDCITILESENARLKKTLKLWGKCHICKHLVLGVETERCKECVADKKKLPLWELNKNHVLITGEGNGPETHSA